MTGGQPLHFIHSYVFDEKRNLDVPVHGELIGFIGADGVLAPAQGFSLGTLKLALHGARRGPVGGAWIACTDEALYSVDDLIKLIAAVPPRSP